ncbi:LAQU0S05e05050g1_1 [Lachancea quebecensis]|uniref:LAQU0S05e05050g1_1 n=1 Tax=Lachancea quebecensis TaxID=1654605 RepID=A0A0P1L0B3_9SACH|nr:LAQU0S05e05050g1_1 [Lachancea quebecensis]
MDVCLEPSAVYQSREEWQHPSIDRTDVQDPSTPRSASSRAVVKGVLERPMSRDCREKETSLSAVPRLEQVFSGACDSFSMAVPYTVRKGAPRARFLVSRLRVRGFAEAFALAGASREPPPSSTLTIFADSYHAVTVECPLDGELLASLFGDAPVCMLLPRELVHVIRTGRLKLRSQVRALSARSITLEDSNSALAFTDFARLVAHSFYKCPHAPFCPIPARAAPRRTPALSAVATAHSCISPEITTHTVRLNKPEITFLIGHQGARVEQLRLQSRAVIKILPIPAKLSTTQLSNPASIEQCLSITGDTESVARAVCLVGALLETFRQAPRHVR